VGQYFAMVTGGMPQRGLLQEELWQEIGFWRALSGAGAEAQRAIGLTAALRMRAGIGPALPTGSGWGLP